MSARAEASMARRGSNLPKVHHDSSIAPGESWCGAQSATQVSNRNINSDPLRAIDIGPIQKRASEKVGWVSGSAGPFRVFKPMRRRGGAFRIGAGAGKGCQVICGTRPIVARAVTIARAIQSHVTPARGIAVAPQPARCAHCSGCALRDGKLCALSHRALLSARQTARSPHRGSRKRGQPSRPECAGSWCAARLARKSVCFSVGAAFGPTALATAAL